MANRAALCAVAIGVAGFFALSATTFAAPKAPDNSYEARGAIPGMPPPVPGFALSGYKPGLCWKVMQNDWQKGSYVDCSTLIKKK
jgi:hypothetical protein